MRPAPLVARDPEVKPESQTEPVKVCCDVVAFANCEVDDAKIPERAQSAVEVAEVDVPKCVGCVHASYAERPEPVMVTGEEPSATNEAQETPVEHETDVVATDDTPAAPFVE